MSERWVQISAADVSQLVSPGSREAVADARQRLTARYNAAPQDEPNLRDRLREVEGKARDLLGGAQKDGDEWVVFDEDYLALARALSPQGERCGGSKRLPGTLGEPTVPDYTVPCPGCPDCSPQGER